MATFEEHIEGLTQVGITASSVPSQSELTGFLVDGLIDCVNKITILKPEELVKFTKTTNATDSVAKKGRILSVLREHDSTSILRICTPIHPSLRYEATDVESLHYRSKYNPGYYERDGLIICVPEASGSGNNDIVVTQVHYDTGLINSDEYNNGVVENFPLEYEYLLGLYASSMVCQAVASDIHNNMPSLPDVVLSRTETELPDYPQYIPPQMEIGYSGIFESIGQEDFDKAEQYFKLLDKEFDKYQKRLDVAQRLYENSVTKFNADLDRLVKNTDRLSAIEAGEYKSRLEKYTVDLQEKTSQYNWYMTQSTNFMNQYNTAIGLRARKTQQEQQTEEG